MDLDRWVLTYSQVLWSIELMQIPALGLVKLSFMFFYRRIFNNGRGKVFANLTWGLIAVIITWIIGFFFAYVFICKGHPSYYWLSLADETAYCVNSTNLHLGYAISDFLLDFIILLFPMPLVWKELRKKTLRVKG